MSNRVPVPKDVEAEVLFKSNHVCAKCHKPELGVQIAHIDNNPKNNKESNLIVLCLNDHNESHKKSPIGKGYSKKELIKYKNEWEKIVTIRRKSMAEPSVSRLIRFDGPNINVNVVYLEIEPGIIRAFKDSLTFNLLGFNWGYVDVYPEKDKEKFTEEIPLKRIGESRKIRLQFSNSSFAREIFIIWEDGRKHHVPDPETLKEIGGFDNIESLDYAEFNAIPHGKTLLSIFTVRIREISKEAMKKEVNKD